MMMFSGERSSCDIVATNSDFSRLAPSSSSTRRAVSSASDARCATPCAIRTSCGPKSVSRPRYSALCTPIRLPPRRNAMHRMIVVPAWRSSAEGCGGVSLMRYWSTPSSSMRWWNRCTIDCGYAITRSASHCSAVSPYPAAARYSWRSPSQR